MTSDHLATALQTVVRVNDTKLFASLELSKSRWLVTVSAPGSEKLSKHVVIGGDGGALLNLLGRLRASAERRGGMAVQVVVIQEAGLDGFWLHRLLEANGIESHVVDPASIAVDRRHRRAKTDVIDGEMLLRTLMAWARGERRVCSMVRPPSPDEEDRRRLTRERGTLLKERTQHTNRIKGLLAGRHCRLRPAPEGSSSPSRRTQDGGRASPAGTAQGGDPPGDRAGRPGRLANGHGRA